MGDHSNVICTSKNHNDFRFALIINCGFLNIGTLKPVRFLHSLWNCLPTTVALCAGTIHGHMQVNNNACVLWIDAHADLNTPKTSPSGNFHGMPLSFILRELEGDVKQLKDAYEEWAWLKPWYEIYIVLSCLIG